MPIYIIVSVGGWAGAKIPVFFLRDESGAVHVENGEGLFFMSPGDAKEKFKDLKSAEGTKVRGRVGLGLIGSVGLWVVV